MKGVIFDGISHQLPDIDHTETLEWVDSFDALLEAHGKDRASFLLMKLLERAKESQVGFPATVSTPYVNTIPAGREPWFPGDEAIERRIRAYIRWNAAVMVVRANHAAEGIGGHLATFASSASLYEVGFNHVFRGKAEGPGLPRRTPVGGPARPLSPRARRHRRRDRRVVFLPAPAAHAGLLGVPHRFDGHRPAQRHLPGALQ